MKLVHVFITILFIALLAPMVLADVSGEKQQAQAGGEQWLGVLDGGSYAAAYDQAAPVVKAAVTKDGWVRQMNAVRAPLGNVASRQVASATYATSLPGAPDGKYVVMQFNTSFQHKKTAVETLTMVLADDGQWKAAGYFIK
jgi:Protein of unknown function (DUF4019)